MAIREKKNKDGTTSFYITVYEGYKIDRTGYESQNRKYKTFKQPVGMSLRRARQIAREIELEFQKQFQMLQSSGQEKRLSEVWEHYKEYYAPNMLRESTIHAMENIVETKILPQIGNLRIGEITTSRITIFLNEISMKRDPETNKPYKPPQYYKDSYVKVIFSDLSRIFTYAIRQGWINDNPCKNAIKPQKNKTKKMKPLEIDQIKDIIKKTTDFTVYNAVIQFQIYTGMRIGETLALTWKDINFDKREIDINKTVNIINQDVIVGPPKTENGYRTLGMSDTVYDLLKLVRLEQKRRKHALKDRYKHPELVFATDDGRYINRNNINHRLAAIKKGTDYDYITVHFLRHANATLLLYNGVDLKVVSSHLGHNDISTTANIYADVLKDQQRHVAQLIEFNLEDDDENTE